MDREKEANDRFACTERERCVFETGIKLATIYHQYVGTPFNAKSVSSLEEAISRSIEVQPYVVSAEVKIDRSVIPDDVDEYSYLSLTGDMIDAVVKVEARLAYKYADYDISHHLRNLKLLEEPSPYGSQEQDSSQHKNQV